jgi:hypothetical protein
MRLISSTATADFLRARLAPKRNIINGFSAFAGKPFAFWAQLFLCAAVIAISSLMESSDD